MTSFGWKRKVISSVNKDIKVNAFEESHHSSEFTEDLTFDWITEAKKRRVVALENDSVRFDRLKQEGILLAEQGRFWEAISRWNDCLLVNDKDVTVLEMKSQALIQVHEWIPAIKCAEQATKLKKNWWPGYQTLGRAQLGLGELSLALRNFKVAFHLNPAQTEIWTEDIVWTKHLLLKAHVADNDKITSEESITNRRIKPDSLQVLIRH